MMKILQARDMGVAGYHIAIHLDTAVVLEDGSPDPASVLALDFGKYNAADVPGRTKPQYIAMLVAEAKALAQDARSRLAGAGSVIAAVEGTTF